MNVFTVLTQGVFENGNITVTIKGKVIEEENALEGTEIFLQQRMFDVYSTNVLILCNGNNHSLFKQLLHQASIK